MNHSSRRKVLGCASPLALLGSWILESARGLAQSNTLPRGFMAPVRVRGRGAKLAMNQIFLPVLALAWLLPTGASADVTLVPVFGDNMVLQRDMPVPIWGVAEPGQTIVASFASQRKTTRADASGNWRVTLKPLRASFEPRSLTIESSAVPHSTPRTLRLTDVLVGEVWLAAGQSNMEWPLAKEAHAATELPAATNASLRLLNFPFAGQYFSAKPFGSNELAHMTPEKFYSGAWQVCSPASAENFSAIAYYFGREVRQELNVPVGVIHLAVGGSPTEAWIRRVALAGDADLRAMTQGNWLTNAMLDGWCRERGGQNLNTAIKSALPIPGDDLGPNHHFKPNFLWDAGPARLLPFAIRGVLWYQGESNALEPRRVAQHRKLFPLLVRDWREQWGQGRLPFLYCQLSSISTNAGYKASCWPEFRDQQRSFLGTIPDIAMAVTSDIGHPTDVHPRNKRDVGHRLALAALAQVYGRGNEYTGPQIEWAKEQKNQVLLKLRHANGLTTSDGKPPNGFEVAADDGVFHPATTEINGETIVLSCLEVPKPRHIRYLWQPFPVPAQNLVNAAGLPASTFRIEVNR